MDGDMCMGMLVCPYANETCACAPAGGGGGNRREWQCGRLPGDGGMNANCPQAQPMSGDSCADAGNGTFCPYGQNAFCFCNRQDAWQCRP
jgi:hypothetical protein